MGIVTCLNTDGYDIEITHERYQRDIIKNIHGYLVPAIVRGIIKSYRIKNIRVLFNEIAYDIALDYTHVEKQFNCLITKEDVKMVFDT